MPFIPEPPSLIELQQVNFDSNHQFDGSGNLFSSGDLADFPPLSHQPDISSHFEGQVRRTFDPMPPRPFSVVRTTSATDDVHQREAKLIFNGLLIQVCDIARLTMRTNTERERKRRLEMAQFQDELREEIKLVIGRDFHKVGIARQGDFCLRSADVLGERCALCCQVNRVP